MSQLEITDSVVFCLNDSHKDDGQIHRLTPTVLLWRTLHTQPWLNCSDETKRRFLTKLSSSHYYSGYIVSVKRSQVELTYIPYNCHKTGPGALEVLSVTLPNVAQYIPL